MRSKQGYIQGGGSLFRQERVVTVQEKIKSGTKGGKGNGI